MLYIYHIVWSRYNGSTKGWLVEAQSKEAALEYVRDRFHDAARVKIKYAGTYCPPEGHVIFKWRAPDDRINFSDVDEWLRTAP